MITPWAELSEEAHAEYLTIALVPVVAVLEFAGKKAAIEFINEILDPDRNFS